jgi:hypothetical protein
VFRFSDNRSVSSGSEDPSPLGYDTVSVGK